MTQLPENVIQIELSSIPLPKPEKDDIYGDNKRRIQESIKTSSNYEVTYEVESQTGSVVTVTITTISKRADSEKNKENDTNEYFKLTTQSKYGETHERSAPNADSLFRHCEDAYARQKQALEVYKKGIDGYTHPPKEPVWKELIPQLQILRDNWDTDINKKYPQT